MRTIHDAYGRDLDLNLLRVFAIVADEGSITRAAARLYVTQPAVSAAMRRLSAFVGTELLTRQGRGVVLSSRGHELLAAARLHLQPLVAAAMAAPTFDPRVSTAVIRLGLADAMETLFLPAFLTELGEHAPEMQVIVVPVQFRSVEAQLLEANVDLAISVADELPRSILRESIFDRASASGGFVCVYDPRFVKLPRVLTEAVYFAHRHVVCSYAGDLRGLVEDDLGKSRKVRVSVPALGHVAEVVDGSALLATVPRLLADQVIATRPHLKLRALPFALEPAGLELLWSKSTDADDTLRFVRDTVRRVGAAIDTRLAKRFART